MSRKQRGAIEGIKKKVLISELAVYPISYIILFEQYEQKMY